MSSVFFISDLHLDHDNILNFAGDYRFLDKKCASVEEHDEILIDRINNRITKRDVLFINGDAAWTRKGLQKIKRLKGNKRLIIGNHDRFQMREYLEVFGDVHGFRKYKGYWLSHCPIHPIELRNRRNIHGHCHQHHIKGDDRYICVSVEQLNGYPISLDEINSKYSGAKIDPNLVKEEHCDL